MPAENFFTFHPERIVWCGLAVLAVISASILPLAYMPDSDSSVRLAELKKNRTSAKVSEPVDFSLTGHAQKDWSCPIPDIRNQAAFSFDPPRPDGSDPQVQLSVRLKQSSNIKRVTIPCRIDLEYRDNALFFADRPTSFWLELKEGLVGTVFVDGHPGDPFRVIPQDSPFRVAQEFQEGSSFKVLAEGRWWGHDLFRQTCAGGKIVHRIEVGALAQAELLDAPENEWIVFREGHWGRLENLNDAEGLPIAIVKSVGSSGLEIEGWEGPNHVRLALPALSNVPFKVKGEELFSSIRIRSDKQISCTLDKQCLILKVGDWVLKTGNRWKVLRKPEEREAFLGGKWAGELFVLDQISNRQGQKSIAGSFYNLVRTQSVAIELPVLARKPASARRNELVDLKGRGKAR